MKGPQTIAAAVEQIDDLQQQLKMASSACDELVAMHDGLRKSALEAMEDRQDAQAKLAHLQQVHAAATAKIVELQTRVAVLETERDTYAAYVRGRNR